VKAHHHFAAGRSELGCIGKQVDEHPLHSFDVAPHIAPLDGGTKANLERLALGQWLCLGDETAQVGDQVVLVDPQAQARLFELG